MSAGIGFLTCNCDGANVVNNTNLTVVGGPLTILADSTLPTRAAF
jgi:hypothetical protein